MKQRTILQGLATLAVVTAAAPITLRSGALALTFGANGTYSLAVGALPPTRGAALSVFAVGAVHTVANGGLACGAPAPASGADAFGAYAGAALLCTCTAARLPAVFSWRAYNSTGDGEGEGRLLASLALPLGANGTAAQGGFATKRTNPQQFAPFPNWELEGAFNSSAVLCYAGDKAHLNTRHARSAGGPGLAGAPAGCFALGNGPATMLWPSSPSSQLSSSGGMQALVAGPASAFHLNYNTMAGASGPSAPAAQAKLWHSEVRGDVALCLSPNCDRTQKTSGYTLLSADEGSVNGARDPAYETLYFSWSTRNKDNWVTNSSACPAPSYTNCGNADGKVYNNGGNMGNKKRVPLLSFSFSNGTHHMAAASTFAQGWAASHGYARTGQLGWVDRPAAPGPAPPPPPLCAAHSGVDYVCCDLKSVPNVSSAAHCCALCRATSGCSAWKINVAADATCFLKKGPLSNPVKVGEGVVVGYSEDPTPGPPGPAPGPGKTGAATWAFGVSGDVLSVPSGFEQSTMLAWDGWGSALRKAQGTRKKADEDIFLAALTLWTDNGAATLGAAWGNQDPKGSPPPLTRTEAPGGVVPPNVSYMNWNWSMVSAEVCGKVADAVKVSTEVYGKVADSVKATGVAPRGTQLDCWWYPVQTAGAAPASSHPFWCVSDWVLPEKFYPGGTGGLRKRQGLPLMMYFPALCVENVFNAAKKYTWTDTAASSGFVIPVAEQSADFWGDMFDYGAMLAAKTVDVNAKPWPGAWAPPAVEAGWKGTNLASYETDFYHNIVASTPQFRQQFGAGEKFLDGINTACAARNMTAQLCAGNPPSFLEALTMPSITNARASIDYDWDGDPAKNSGPRSSNGAHNWAAPDNAWVFRASRIAPSKDNFWSSWRDLKVDGGNQDSGRNGKDSEMHAAIALLLTGPVGLGDTCVRDECMVNATLVRRLARADGILLRPDLPLMPVDVMWGGLLGPGGAGQATHPPLRAMPGLCTAAQEKQGPSASCGARLWQTHATVFAEDAAKAPELATTPTRRLVSHAGVDATAQATVAQALAADGPSGGRYLLQHLVVSVDQPQPFELIASDLYPRTRKGQALVFWRQAQDGGGEAGACAAGSDALGGGCVHLDDAMDPRMPLFDVSTKNFSCSQPPYAGPPAGMTGLPAGPNCLHSFGLWQAWGAAASAEFVLLGDLTKYVSLSGYRFRIPKKAKTAAGAVGESLIVVGMPAEAVDVTYLRKSASGSKSKNTSGSESGSRGQSTWKVHVQRVVIGSTGRTLVTLNQSER